MAPPEQRHLLMKPNLLIRRKAAQSKTPSPSKPIQKIAPFIVLKALPDRVSRRVGKIASTDPDVGARNAGEIFATNLFSLREKR